jgi:hypothetical protein
MQVPPNGSPIWSIARIAVLGTIFIVSAHVWYLNGWGVGDFRTLVGLVLTSYGFDKVKNTLTKPSDSTPDGEGQ